MSIIACLGCGDLPGSEGRHLQKLMAKVGATAVAWDQVATALSYYSGRKIETGAPSTLYAYSLPQPPAHLKILAIHFEWIRLSLRGFR